MPNPSLTTLDSKSVGPDAGLWRPLARCLGHVCYLYRAYVHADIYCQTAQVCHFVSLLHLNSKSVPTLPCMTPSAWSEKGLAGKGGSGTTFRACLGPLHPAPSTCEPNPAGSRIRRVMPVSATGDRLRSSPPSCGPKVRRAATRRSSLLKPDFLLTHPWPETL